MRGQIVHHALHEFALNHPKSLPDDIAAELIASADSLLAALGGSPRVEAFWRPGFARFAKWFAEPSRRGEAASDRIVAEVDGALDLEIERGFRLTARADRIDLCEDGSAVIYDYKTGQGSNGEPGGQTLRAAASARSRHRRRRRLRPQSGRARCVACTYIRASGRGDGGEQQQAAKASPAGLAEKALADLARLIEHFDRAETPYEAQRRPGTAFSRIYDYDDYAHLARLAEWETLGLEEDIW